MRILDEFYIYEVLTPASPTGGRRIRVWGPTREASERFSHRSGFVLYCNGDCHPDVVVIIASFPIVVLEGKPVVMTIGGQTLVDDQPVLVKGKPIAAVGDWEKLHAQLSAEGRESRGRFDFRCGRCADRANRKNDAAPVSVLKSHLSDHVQKLAGHGVPRLSLAGLRGRLY